MSRAAMGKFDFLDCVDDRCRCMCHDPNIKCLHFAACCFLCKKCHHMIKNSLCESHNQRCSGPNEVERLVMGANP